MELMKFTFSEPSTAVNMFICNACLPIFFCCQPMIKCKVKAEKKQKLIYIYKQRLI